MVVAVVAVDVVQATIDQIICVIPVRHRGVAAVGSVDMGFVMPGTRLVAFSGVGISDRDRVLSDPRPLLMFQMAMVEVVHVSLVTDANVAAPGPVLMRLASLTR